MRISRPGTTGPQVPAKVEPQRRLVEGVHAIFPEPVPYLDRCGMISSFPRARVFMSTYILQRYRERGVPAMARIVAEDQPRFLLANVSGLALEQPWDTVQTYERRLLKEDFEFLQNNFVHHWGAIWVPGKRLTLSGSAGTPFLIAVAGPYTVESERAFTIDGVLTHHDDVIQLGAGDHVATGTGSVTLRYGARLPRPPFHPSPRRLFRNLSEFE